MGTHTTRHPRSFREFAKLVKACPGYLKGGSLAPFSISHLRLSLLERALPSNDRRVPSDINGQEEKMNEPTKSTRTAFRIGTSRPATQLASFRYGTTNLMLYRLYTICCIACSRMSRAATACRNNQYELLGIKARWVGKNETRKRIRLSAPSRRREVLRSTFNLQVSLEGDLGEMEAKRYHRSLLN